MSPINEADAGMVCAVTGLDHTYPGQGFGIEAQENTGIRAGTAFPSDYRRRY